MENSWYIVNEDQSDTDSSNNSRNIEETTDDSLSEQDLNAPKNDESKYLNDMNEVKINDVLGLLSDSNNKRLQSIVKTSNEKSLMQKSASNTTFEYNQTFKHVKEKIESSPKVETTNKITDMLSTLSNRQSQFIQHAKDSNGPKPLSESAKELNDIKTSNIIAAAYDEMCEVLRDDDNIVYKMESLKASGMKLPAQIVSPVNDEPKISVEQLLSANQTDAQFMVSTIKQRNKNFMENLFDF